MSYNEPLPAPPGRIYGDGADAASSTFRAQALVVGTTVEITPLAGMGSTTKITLTNPSFAKARLVECAAKIAAGEGFDGIDVDDLPGEANDIKASFKESTGEVKMFSAAAVHAQNGAMIGELATVLGVLGF